MNHDTKRGALNKSLRVRHPIGLKLSLIISVILIVSLFSITFLVSFFVRSDEQITAESNNFTINQRSANAVSSEFDTIRNNAFLMIDLIQQNRQNEENTAAHFFGQEQQPCRQLSISGKAGGWDGQVFC